MQVTSLSFDEIRSIDKVDLAELGPIVVVAGPNGSGKTTLLSVLRALALIVMGAAASEGEPELDSIRRDARRLSVNLELRFSPSEQERLGVPASARLIAADAARAGVQGVPPALAQRWSGSDPAAPVFEYIGSDRRLGPPTDNPMDLERRGQERLRARSAFVDAGQRKFENLRGEIWAMSQRDMRVRALGRGEALLVPAFLAAVNSLLDSKKLLEPVPNDELMPTKVDFVVETERGKHDLESLSDGELQMVMLVSRIVHHGARGSVIMIDEPELHLHPNAVAQLLDAFGGIVYKTDGQVWIATQSPTVIDAVDLNRETLVFLPGGSKGTNVAVQIRSDDDRLAGLRSLGGRLSAFVHRQKVVWVEGPRDEAILCAIEPRARRARFIPSGGKPVAARASEAVMAAIDQATHYESFVAILDGDLDPVLEEMGLKPPRAITHRRLIIWERYHIENYLLEPKALVAVHDELHGAKRFASESHAEESLKAHADSLRPTLEANCVEVAVWQACGLEIKLDPDELLASLARCAEEQAQRIGTTLQDPRWRELRVRGVSEWFANHWDREWRRICRGRDVLQAFHIEHVSPAVMPFDAYVEAVARKIGQLGVEDPKVRTVLDAICATA